MAKIGCCKVIPISSFIQQIHLIVSVTQSRVTIISSSTHKQLLWQNGLFDTSNKYITFEMVKYNELFRLLKKDGWYIVRQRGSHVILQHKEKKGQLTVPFHGSKEVKKGLLRSIMNQADIKQNQ